ncbi:MAG: class I SAM-dependent methyltransferase [Patescibacteria group bacterium]
MEIINQCPLCGSDKLTKFYQGIDRYYSGEEVECSACRDCSLILLNPRLTEEEYKNWYESVFQNKRRNIETVEQVVAGIKKKNKYQKKLKELKYFKNYINKNARCLEIGAGWGTLAKAVKDNFHCEIDLIEPSKLGAKVAREYFKLKVYNDTFNNFFSSKQNELKYNLIYAYHVFEHISDPNEFLEKIKNLLKDNGKILLALPNTLKPEQPSERLFHIDHCFYYTPETLEFMLNKHGFKIIKLWQCATDMKVICQFEKNLAVNDFYNQELNIVKKRIIKMDKKYKILRFIKRVVYFPLNSDQRERINKIIFKYKK